MAVPFAGHLPSRQWGRSADASSRVQRPSLTVLPGGEYGAPPGTGQADDASPERADPEGGATPLVLIVDDDHAIRQALETVLSMEGLDCVNAANGAEALELLRRLGRRPDLIILDLMMPVVNGFEFRAAQLADPQLAGIPTIVLSAADAPGRVVELGVAEVLRKPAGLDAVLDAVERSIPGRNLVMNADGTHGNAISSDSVALSDANFRLLVDSVRDYAIYMLSPSGTVLSWNAGAARIKGYQPHEIIGKNFRVFYMPEDIAAGRPDNELKVATETGRYEEEWWRLRKNGTRFRAHVVVTALRDATGALTGFAKVTQDVTQRYEAELALRESEERFRILVEQISDYAIFMLDPQARISTWNLGAERIKGYKAEEVLGRLPTLFYTPEDKATDKLGRLVRQATATGVARDTGLRLRKDGSRFWADVTLTALHDPHGNLYGFAKVVRDLTERVEAEEQARAYEAAKQAVQARHEFLSVAAHELRTPLTALQLHLQSVNRHIVREPSQWTPARIANGIKLAIESSDRLAQLVESLLDVSRIATGRITLDLSEFDLGDVVAGAMQQMGALIRQFDCKVAVQAHRGVVGRWDRLRIEQILMNLVSNACKYAPGTSVEVGLEQAGGRVRLHVRDCGPGIAPEHLERIFERFERAVSSDHHGGLGLGLYVTRQIAEVHGGKVRVESRPGAGSTFTIELPLVTDDRTLAERL